MVPLRIKTKYFTLEIFRRGIVFTIASLLLVSGANLVNGNIFLALISIFNKQVFNEDNNEYGFWIGIILILFSLFLFYLIIINWRIEIYSKTFIQLRKCLDKYGTAINHRLYYYYSEKIRTLHTEAYNEYLKTVNFLSENQTNLDIQTYEAAVDLNSNIGKKFLELDVYIKEINKIENNVDTQYNPQLANRELIREIDELKNQMDSFASLIKKKEKFKILNQK
ncbi:hypothetical protein QX233_05815 [Chryseobacterium gambrini]|uniref:Uncharacterized protein n=1 Tax=Chryseobacterium gambrini TaxID=373672 RepID=A0AAJ1R1A9_9FLAO|nr:hypothetical protein [Chryseobacterium gambrini]MDN4011966.1 hypothetical protein [Chryseobacterium gambrini]